jgi:hypothetical protein
MAGETIFGGVLAGIWRGWRGWSYYMLVVYYFINFLIFSLKKINNKK